MLGQIAHDKIHPKAYRAPVFRIYEEMTTIHETVIFAFPFLSLQTKTNIITGSTCKESFNLITLEKFILNPSIKS